MAALSSFASSSLLPLFLLSLSSFVFCHFRPHFPPFLQKASVEQRRQYNRIVTSQNDTKAQINSNVQNWASNAGVASDYNNFTSEQQQRSQQFHDAVTGNLTSQALQLFNNLWSIRQNDQITRLAECQQIRAALNATGRDHVLHLLVPIPPPSIVGPPPSGCFPRPPHLKPFGGGFGPKSGGAAIPGRGGPQTPERRNNIGTEEGEEKK
ncbi:hypothetical protein niasHS_002606 [Heterodera schachtii]|uniref:SXP/RAL-2 family protein Ani s 5-like cation-binding domain-containing protein n=1 Tax=Heterodera schachtii TaxID=97005 RepID=A0ABD2KLC7_HETSC